MSKKGASDAAKTLKVVDVDPTECPFREFRDNELQPEFWGLNPAAYRSAVLNSKAGFKLQVEQVWIDDQTQPLPRSVRRYLNGWVRAEELAMNRWNAETVVYEENNGGKMSIIDYQLSHAQVIFRSSFCRKVLSTCFVLERADPFMVEHQWEYFSFSIPPEGWRAKYHIYSPSMKPGGGTQHKPGLSRNAMGLKMNMDKTKIISNAHVTPAPVNVGNVTLEVVDHYVYLGHTIQLGCYLVRLFYLGAWRCVWVSDKVPVDVTDSPLLPFSPLNTQVPPPPVPPTSKASTKPAVAPPVTSPVVQLWPLLICKALLKLAAPDMNSDEDLESADDELMQDFSILHSLTGSVRLDYQIKGSEELWKLITTEVSVFSWDDDDETQQSTIKTKSTKKSTVKESTVRSSLTILQIRDSKNIEPYILPGITPAYEMTLAVNVARDLPLKKPLPEPGIPEILYSNISANREVALWKHYRWIDWAKKHGLYDAYACPDTRFLKVNGFLKLSHAPQLLDVQSTESIYPGYREVHYKLIATIKKSTQKEVTRSTANIVYSGAKEEFREWVLYDAIYDLVTGCKILYYPSMFQFTSAGSKPPVRMTKGLSNKPVDIVAPKCSPFYLQIDGPEVNTLKISLNMLHPRILVNSGIPIVDYIEPAYLILEEFQWFVDCDLPKAKAYVQTRGYDSVEVRFEPGRHICRLWVHSRMNWHIMLISESTLLLNTKDVIKSAAVKECPWAAKFLSNLGVSFSNWIRVNRSNLNVIAADREFFKSYQPDLEWNQEKIGFSKSLLHWMFRQALKSVLAKRLLPLDFRGVCTVLRRYFCDPEFGLPDKLKLQQSVWDIANLDPCDCIMEEAEVDFNKMCEEQEIEEIPFIDEEIMAKLLMAPEPPITSQICELATEDLPCEVLKEEREKVIKKHKAATILQAHWRGTWARRCLKTHVVFTPEITKLVMENAFGNMEALSVLMNEFFAMYPTVKSAYSVASALTGTYGLRQFSGVTPVPADCRWIPFFQGTFNCHEPVKVHLDLHSSLQFSTVAVYDNDTGLQKPQVYNAHITFEFHPNNSGYTIMGHGTLHKSTNTATESQWQLTVLSSIDEAFHICDNDPDDCKDLPLPHSQKFHLDEIFMPNRRNILGSVQVSVVKNEVVSFRAVASSEELEMEVILRTIINGEKKDIAKCFGKGEVYWPYLKLEATALNSDSMTASKGDRRISRMSKSPKTKANLSSKAKSSTKLKTLPPDPILYYIEVEASHGWPLSLSQWKRVLDIRNSPEFIKIDLGQHKKTMKEKPASASAKSKDRGDKQGLEVSILQPQFDDAFVTLECSLAIGGGAIARRDDDRDLELAAAIRSWDLKEPGRNQRGGQIRKEFRAEFLEVLTVPPYESEHSLLEENLSEELSEENKKNTSELQQGPTPASESRILDISLETEEETKYLSMPEQLKDKFIPLSFVPECLKEKDENTCVLVTPDIAEAAKQDRHARMEAAIDRMRELQAYNEEFVLGQQKTRITLLEKLFIDSEWNQELEKAFTDRDDAIATEMLSRNLSVIKKKQETKKK